MIARSAAVRQRAHEDHFAIIAALRKRDATAAAAAMSAHLDGIQQALDADDINETETGS